MAGDDMVEIYRRIVSLPLPARLDVLKLLDHLELGIKALPHSQSQCEPAHEDQPGGGKT